MQLSNQTILGMRKWHSEFVKKGKWGKNGSNRGLFTGNSSIFQIKGIKQINNSGILSSKKIHLLWIRDCGIFIEREIIRDTFIIRKPSVTSKYSMFTDCYQVVRHSGLNERTCLKFRYVDEDQGVILWHDLEKYLWVWIMWSMLNMIHLQFVETEPGR